MVFVYFAIRAVHLATRYDNTDPVLPGLNRPTVHLAMTMPRHILYICILICCSHNTLIVIQASFGSGNAASHCLAAWCFLARPALRQHATWTRTAEPSAELSGRRAQMSS